jgi:flagellar M-ring protein FliF
MPKLVAFFRTLGPARLAIAGAATAALLGLFAWLIFASNEPKMSLLYGDLDMSDAARVIAQLDAAKVAYRLGGDGASVFVPEDQVARLRVTLAEQGVPAGGSIGYEIFDRTSALGSTSFLQDVNLARALEGELARTMRSIQTVKTARVHLVIPRRELFSRHRQEPSASVLLQMRGAARLTPGQISAVQHLIASAVPGLSPTRISIIDGQGTLLSATADESGDALAGGKAEERRHQLEARLSRAIEELVERTVGPGKVRAEVYAEMDFDRIDTSQEVYDPDGQVVRSTQNVQENNKNSDSSGNAAVGVAGNLPDTNASSGATQQTSASENRSEETVNYEISKKVISHVREAGIVKRLSVAVLVDGTYVTGQDGSRSYQPRSPEELEQLANLVRSTVGFNAERGDKIEVVNMRYVEPEVTAEDVSGLLFGLERNDLMRLAQYLVLFVLAILVLLLVVRPLIKRAIEAMPVPAAAVAPGLIAAASAGAAGTTPQLAAPDAQARTGEHPQLEAPVGTEEMVGVEHVAGRVRSSALRRVTDIVERHPDETLAILRTWLHADQEALS